MSRLLEDTESANNYPNLQNFTPFIDLTKTHIGDGSCLHEAVSSILCNKAAQTLQNGLNNKVDISKFT